jgi:hypothetical protein
VSALRFLACAACVAVAAVLAGRAVRAGEPQQAPEAPPPAAAEADKADRAAAAAHPAPRTASWSGPERPRVTPGVLVRAAKRAQQRDAATCGPCAARGASGAAAGQAVVESIEIDWHAATAAP